MLYLLVRFLHIASAIWFLGGILARQIVRVYAKRTDDVQRFAAMSEQQGVSKAQWSSPATWRSSCSGSL